MSEPVPVETVRVPDGSPDDGAGSSAEDPKGQMDPVSLIEGLLRVMAQIYQAPAELAALSSWDRLLVEEACRGIRIDLGPWIARGLAVLVIGTKVSTIRAAGGRSEARSRRKRKQPRASDSDYEGLD